MRLLYVIDSLAPGGAETSLVEMAPGLVEMGIDLHVLALQPKLDLGTALKSQGATVYTGSRELGRIGNVYMVADAVRRIEPHLVHTTLYEADLAGRIAARLKHTRVSTSVVGDSYGAARRKEIGSERLRLALAADRLTARFATRIHAVSESVAHSITRDLRFPQSRIDVIPRGRNPHKYRYRPVGLGRRTRNSLAIPVQAPVILAVGRLEPAKGFEVLMRSLTGVAARFSDLVVLLAGKDGQSSRELKQSASHINADIRFLGHRNDVNALLSAADVLCFPSHREGSPGTVIEAMAAGCHVVASDIEPNQEVLGRGPASGGRTFRTGDHQHLSSILITALDDPGGSLRMAQMARARFEEFYTIDAIARRMYAFFDSTATGRLGTPVGRGHAPHLDTAAP
ncbi:glycosyltransferase [Intrasporangium sp. DVR]|uniref:glycosyltransferase n=1 Tax=Intrasporangium sp. DVR TaxID=3127867 RepID=UPI00313A6DAF